MKARKFLGLLLALFMVVTTAGIPVVPAAAAETGVQQDSRVTMLKDMSLDADVDTDYVSPWENVGGINTDWEPTKSKDSDVKGWGNWHQDPGSEHWVQYDWDKEITTSEMQIFWYDNGDNDGVRMPATLKIQYKDATGEYVDAHMITDYADAQALDQYNIIQFDEIKTTSVRLLMTVRSDAGAIGIYRWKVMANVEMPEREVIELDKTRLTIPASVSDDTMELPLKSENGYDISWESDNDAIKIEGGSGIVTWGDQEVTVKLTATITGKTIVTGEEAPYSVRKEFEIVVPAYYLVRDEVKAVDGSYEGQKTWGPVDKGGQSLACLNDNDLGEEEGFWTGYWDPQLNISFPICRTIEARQIKCFFSVVRVGVLACFPLDFSSACPAF